jgi:hypothetical protein
MSAVVAHDIRPGDISLPPTYVVDLSDVVALLTDE